MAHQFFCHVLDPSHAQMIVVAERGPIFEKRRQDCADARMTALAQPFDKTAGALRRQNAGLLGTLAQSR